MHFTNKYGLLGIESELGLPPLPDWAGVYRISIMMISRLPELILKTLKYPGMLKSPRLFPECLIKIVRFNFQRTLQFEIELIYLCIFLTFCGHFSIEISIFMTARVCAREVQVRRERLARCYR